MNHDEWTGRVEADDGLHDHTSLRDLSRTSNNYFRLLPLSYYWPHLRPRGSLLHNPAAVSDRSRNRSGYQSTPLSISRRKSMAGSQGLTNGLNVRHPDAAIGRFAGPY